MAFDRDKIKQVAAELAANGIFIGTSSWKYEGWFGQLYTPTRYEYRDKGYSRTIENHRYALALFVCAYNWCKVHSTLGCTPAVGIKLASETWTIERLIDEATKNQEVFP